MHPSLIFFSLRRLCTIATAAYVKYQSVKTDGDAVQNCHSTASLGKKRWRSNYENNIILRPVAWHIGWLVETDEQRLDVYVVRKPDRQAPKLAGQQDWRQEAAQRQAELIIGEDITTAANAVKTNDRCRANQT